MTDFFQLSPGNTIGILGGGQLGRMLALAAYRLGMKVHILCPDSDCPAFAVTPHKTIASYTDQAALTCFADAVDVVTYEFENVPATTAQFLAQRKQLRPGARALAIAQDRLEEKTFLSGIGVPVADYLAVTSPTDLLEAINSIGTPAVLKTTRLGYDGKGQVVIRSADEAAAAFDVLSPKPLVLERYVPFTREISVVAARGADGSVRAYEPAENRHVGGILRSSTVPAQISDALAERAYEITAHILTSLDYVGVIGVEFFIIDDRDLLVNEIAPRVHNSGHWTEAVCAADQFEQHIRAVAGWPLGDTSRFADVVMENVLGEAMIGERDLITRGTRPHLYGKTEARPGRKMGHVNRILRPI